MRTEVLHEFEKIPLFNISSVQWIELLALQEADKLLAEWIMWTFSAWLLMN